LVALRHREESLSEIAIAAKLDLRKTAIALGALERFGCAEQGDTNRWYATVPGKTCRFEIIPDRRRRNSESPGPSGRRLLELLDRPMPGSKIAAKLGVTRQRVRQLMFELHAQGLVAFGDPDNPSWIVMRAADKTRLLSRDEERVLSVTPREYATDVAKIRLAARLSESRVHQILERLVVVGLVEAFEGLRGNRVFRITEAGLEHAQRAQSARHARAPRPPVESDRVRKVLSAISDARELRIRDVMEILGIPRQSINALMQYLKRKRLVEKTGHEFNAPYAVTEEGHAALTELTRRQAA
jgi:DNA-binding IclR family transcriptional regulator